MRHELRAVKARIDALSLRTWIGEVPESTPPPYVSISAPADGVPDEYPVCGPGDTTQVDMRVLLTHTNEDNVHHRLKAIRADLSPSKAPSRLEVPGRYVTVEYVRSEFVMRDTDFIFPVTGRTAAYGVDTYRIHSQPLP